MGDAVEQVVLVPLSILLAGFQGSEEAMSLLALMTILRTSEVAGHHKNGREVSNIADCTM